MGRAGDLAALGEDKALRNLIKVDHAGEYGAIGIYRAQILISRLLWRDLVPQLQHMLGHEREHFARFEVLRQRHGARRCRVFFLWTIGGWLLGFFTALMGRNAIRLCTYAVEDTVNRHLEEQIAFTRSRAPDVAAELVSIQREEREHQHFGERGLRRGGPWRLLEGLVRGSTETVIMISMRI